MNVYQNTTASDSDTDRLELDQVLEANAVYATSEAAMAAHQADSDTDRRAFDDPDLVPAALDWALTSGENGLNIWEATDDELGYIYRVTECKLLG